MMKRLGLYHSFMGLTYEEKNPSKISELKAFPRVIYHAV